MPEATTPGTQTILSVIQRLLPDGSRPEFGTPVSDGRTWASCPEWPADVFAIMATLVEQSDCHTCIGAEISHKQGMERWKDFNDKVRRLGRQWADGIPEVPTEVEERWTRLIEAADRPLDHRNSVSDSWDNPEDLLPWERNVLELLAIADEAGRGFGWPYPGSGKAGHEPAANGDAGTAPSPPTVPEDMAGVKALRVSSFAGRFVYDEYRQWLKRGQPPDYLCHLPNSICHLVPKQLVCVQPEANTAQVGCTIRALSHHMALLPGIGVAESEWIINPFQESEHNELMGNLGSLNVLIVPFPYEVRGSDFKVSDSLDDSSDGLFTVTQGWLGSDGGPRITPRMFSDFIVSLIDVAHSEVGHVDIVVLPELALKDELAEKTAKLIARHYHRRSGRKARARSATPSGGNLARTPDGSAVKLGPDLLICGTSGEGSENVALTLALEGEEAYVFPQSKHHRWRIDGNQIKTYHLGHAFHPKRRYWERIPLRERHLRFLVNRGCEVIAALVCEDLARSDPVMPVLTSVGPNLVVALLMDGPQLIGRWPGRYVTVLADDPGCAVLSVTSLGMVLRSRAPDKALPGDEGRRCIAVWREPNQTAQELDLSPGAHAMVLALNGQPSRQTALDMRDDAAMGFRLELSAVRSVRLRNPPSWLHRGDDNKILTHPSSKANQPASNRSARTDGGAGRRRRVA